MIAVVDYGIGNLGSVKNALDYIGAESVITDDAAEIENADGIVLPGVGDFGFAMDNLRKRNLEAGLINQIKLGKPFLGICLGLQMLFENSEENPGTAGLGIFKGNVRKFPSGMGVKIPHIGWNSINSTENMPILGEFNGKYLYFVHSFYVEPADMDDSYSRTVYGVEFPSALEYKNILACQFHPEKSGKTGLAVLKKWTDGTV